ncbi:tetratricopeptide repeat protein [Mycobacterium hubeiense]|uniref:tetratricopeptide repeat protein n=1 Tax=Mycobacterium hubeiense TaxID=1867256 RepID=UPI000C7F34EC|nr:tetratricopeptide repeat protein [Mycobacterium sp. QGD 101]
MTVSVLGALEAIRPQDEAVERAGPVRPGDVAPLLTATDKRQKYVDVDEVIFLDAKRAHDRALRRVDAVRSSTTLAALAQTHAALGNAEPAVDAAREAIDKSVDVSTNGAFWIDPSAVRIAVEILSRYDCLEYAYEALGRAPIPASLCVTYAAVAFALGKYEEAENALAPYDNWAVEAFRGYVYASLGRYKEAVHSLRQAVRKEPEDVDSLLNLAFSLWQLGSIEKATRVAYRATRIAPGRKDLSLLYLDLLLAVGNADRAAQEIAQLKSRKVVADARFLEAEGRTLLLRNDFSRALTLLTSASEAAKREGDHVTEGRVRANVVRFKYTTGRLDYDNASQELSALVSQFPGNDAVVVTFAEVAHKRQDAQQLRAALSNLESSTTAIRRAYIRHQIAFLEGDNQAAASAAEEWFDLEPNNAMAASAALVSIGIGMGNWSKATVVARDALEKFPDDLSIINSAAYVFAMSGRADEAIRLIEPFAEGHFVLSATLGLAHLAAGNVDKGMKLYREAADLAEAAEPTWRSLMTLYQALIVRQLGLDKAIPQETLDALALVPVPLPDDWRDRPDFLRVHYICEKNGFDWPICL